MALLGHNELIARVSFVYAHVNPVQKNTLWLPQPLEFKSVALTNCDPLIKTWVIFINFLENIYLYVDTGYLIELNS